MCVLPPPHPNCCHCCCWGKGQTELTDRPAQYLAEEGDKCVFKAAVVCSNPWNLELCCKNLHRTCLGQMYSRAMGESVPPFPPSSHNH